MCLRELLFPVPSLAYKSGLIAAFSNTHTCSHACTHPQPLCTHTLMDIHTHAHTETHCAHTHVPTHTHTLRHTARTHAHRCSHTYFQCPCVKNGAAGRAPGPLKRRSHTPSHAPQQLFQASERKPASPSPRARPLREAQGERTAGSLPPTLAQESAAVPREAAQHTGANSVLSPCGSQPVPNKPKTIPTHAREQ